MLACFVFIVLPLSIVENTKKIDSLREKTRIIATSTSLCFFKQQKLANKHTNHKKIN